MAYKKSAAIENALAALETSFAGNCERSALNHVTAQGNRRVQYVKINTGVADAIPVLFTGGIHARELAPPDALLSFCLRLLSAFYGGTDITYPVFTDATGVVYDQFVIPNAAVDAIFRKFDLYVVPCVNPDGRDYALSGSTSANLMWRKNRRRDPQCPGVDINRNFPIAWDQDVYYSAKAARRVRTSKDPCEENFRGWTLAPPPMGPAPEPETKNLMEFVAEKEITYLVDVHSFGRKILYPWGMEQSQSVDPVRSFLNPQFDYQRDGPHGSNYSEYFPDGPADARGRLLTRHKALAAAMAKAITDSAGSDVMAIQRSVYTPQPSSKLYPITGAFPDYAVSRQFIDPLLPNIHAFTLEAGLQGGQNLADPDDDDGGFWPDLPTQYPKVEREIHAALFGLLAAI